MGSHFLESSLRMHWTVLAGLSVFSVADASVLETRQELLSNQYNWLSGVNLKDVNVKMEKVEVPHYPILGVVPSGCIKQVSSALACASGCFDEETCQESGFTDLAPNAVVVKVDERANTIYFGYNFMINRGLKHDNDYFRNKIFQRAEEVWPKVLEVIVKYPAFQQFHVGFESGGSMAFLISYRVLTARSLPYRQFRKNYRNQIKVVTVDELPVFVNTFNVNPVRKSNHLVIRSEKIEISEFHSMGTTITDLEIKKKQVESRVISLEMVIKHTYGRNAARMLSSLKSKGLVQYQDKVSSSLKIIDSVAVDLEAIIQDNVFELYGENQRKCAAAVQASLSSYLPDAGKELVCTVVEKRREAVGDGTKFDVECNLLKTSKILREQAPGHSEDYFDNVTPLKVASFTAELNSYKDHQNSCSALQVKVNPTSTWGKCLQEIVANSPELRLISPYSKGDGGNCKFFALLQDNEDWSRNPSGCSVKPRQNDKELENLIAVFPQIFFSMFHKKDIRFPDACQGIMRKVPFPDSILEQKNDLFKSVATYLAEMNIAKKRYNRERNTLPTMFTKHDTKTFATKEVILSDKFVANAQVADLVLKCLSSRKLEIINCNTPGNLWIPGVCPKFCNRDNGKRELELCEAMAYCSNLDAFIGATRMALATLRLSSPIANTKTGLSDGEPVAQYGLYNFKYQHRWGVSVYEFGAGIFFNKLPDGMLALNPDNLEEAGDLNWSE